MVWSVIGPFWLNMENIFCLEYLDRRVEYELRKSSKARNIRISIEGSGLVSVTLPKILPDIFAHRFIKEKADWILKKINELDLENRFVLPKITRNEYKKYRLQAHELVLGKIEKYNKYYNFFYNNISIKDQKTRWGSCSSNRNLNFNYKLLFLKDYLVDYVVVHELCHLKEMNHSKDFWNLVSECIGEYKKIRKELKEVRIE